MAESFRLVVLGGSGQLGSDIVRSARIRGWDATPLGREDVDITRPASVEAELARGKPQIVVNCAALHQVDYCEDAHDEAFAVNAEGARNVAEAAKQAGARLVHVSTDYVFDGRKPPPTDGRSDAAHAYVETDEARPINVYGESKLAGERLVLARHPDALVVRTSSLFGAVGSRGKGGNFVETMIRKGLAGEEIRVVDDQWMTPTYTAHAAEAVLDAARTRQTGLLHVTNPSACTWFEFAARALALVGFAVKPKPIKSADFASKAKRPANSALCTDRMRAYGLRPLPFWPEALRVYLAEKGHIQGPPRPATLK